MRESCRERRWMAREEEEEGGQVVEVSRAGRQAGAILREPVAAQQKQGGRKFVIRLG